LAPEVEELLKRAAERHGLASRDKLLVNARVTPTFGGPAKFLCLAVRPRG
jgi:hypothetical protein